MARFRKNTRKRLEHELGQLREHLEHALDWLTDIEVALGLRPDPYPEPPPESKPKPKSE